jgi:hypothetical protein
MIDGSATMRSNLQAIYDAPLLQMFRNDLIEVLLVQVGVPNTFRIDHDHRPLATPVQATGAIDTHPALARQAQGLDPIFDIGAQLRGAALLTALAAIVPFIGTEKYMVAVIHIFSYE